jgi:hypothetical protein
MTFSAGARCGVANQKTVPDTLFPGVSCRDLKWDIFVISVSHTKQKGMSQYPSVPHAEIFCY